MWVSGAIRGSIHDTKAARIWRIPRLLAEYGLFALGDKDYEGLDHTFVLMPFKGKGKPEWQKEYNRLHVRLRGPGERMFAQLKKWSIFGQIRCDPVWTTRIAKAVQVLNSYEHRSSRNRFSVMLDPTWWPRSGTANLGISVESGFSGNRVGILNRAESSGAVRGGRK